MNQLINLEVGGQPFKATREVLSRSKTLANMMSESDQSEPIIIPRSGKVFDEVLAYLIDPYHHPFPKNLVYELEYYDIDYEISEKHSEYINKTRCFFCLNTECETRLPHDKDDEKYCDEHRCAMKGCHEARKTKYCNLHEKEIGWCDELVYEKSGKLGISLPKRRCGESKSCEKCKK